MSRGQWRRTPRLAFCVGPADDPEAMHKPAVDGSPESEPEPFDALSDPVIAAAVEQALEPYRSLLPEATLAEMREALADFLVMHPVTNRLARRLKEREVAASAEQAIDAAEDIGSSPPDERNVG